MSAQSIIRTCLRGLNTRHGSVLLVLNIVGKVEMVGMVGDQGLTTEFAVADMKQKGYKACALILQGKTANGYPGPIIGASVISDL